MSQTLISYSHSRKTLVLTGMLTLTLVVTICTEYISQTYGSVWFSFPGVYTPANATGQIDATTYFEEQIINSLYGTASVGFRDYLFADFTIRNDWSSSLPVKNNSFMYPSVNLFMYSLNIWNYQHGFLMVKLEVVGLMWEMVHHLTPSNVYVSVYLTMVTQCSSTKLHKLILRFKTGINSIMGSWCRYGLLQQPFRFRSSLL